MEFAKPYLKVIFKSHLKNKDGYKEMTEKMLELARQSNGFLGVETSREKDGSGLTISYWQDRESIKNWKNQPQHKEAQRLGKERWYSSYHIEIIEIN